MIFIHIGLQKTGTTSLQYYLKGSNILKYPLDKPRFVKTREGNLKTSGNQTFFKKCKNNQLIKTSFANSNREIKIITCENFSSPYDKLLSLKNLLNFLTKEKINFKILYTSRNFEDYCKSLYAEEVTNSFSCEMRSYKKFRKYTELHILNLEKIITKYPLIQFEYSKKVNAEILKTILKYEKYDEMAIVNFKKNKKKFKVDIKKIEKIAFSNRFFGWLSIYRYKLRYRFKNDYLKAPPIYIFGTYLRSLINLFLLNNYWK